MSTTKVWVSWDTEVKGVESNPCLTDEKPNILPNGDYGIGDSNTAVDIHEAVAWLLGVKPGECKMFEIREVSNGTDQ